jgi:hypothetical protein
MGDSEEGGVRAILRQFDVVENRIRRRNLVIAL